MRIEFDGMPEMLLSLLLVIHLDIRLCQVRPRFRHLRPEFGHAPVMGQPLLQRSPLHLDLTQVHLDMRQIGLVARQLFRPLYTSRAHRTSSTSTISMHPNQLPS
jgi:hypothetical protein